MDNSMNAEERRDAWIENQFQYGEDHHYWDYAQWVAEMLAQALEHIEGLVGSEHAAGPLRELVDPVAVISYPNAKTWRDVVDDVFFAGTIWPIGERLNHALLYGFYGVTPVDVSALHRAKWIADLVDEVTIFAARNDIVSLGGGDNAILRISGLAASRHALDQGRGEVDILSMSIFGSVSEGRLRNLMAGATAQLERGANGGIVALSALCWLQKRTGFLASIWQEDTPVKKDKADRIVPELMIFVPVARDGSIFNPDLIRNGQYQIGAKGEEQHFDTFDAALEGLNAMPIPRWRRPNEQGNWGIVSGVAWQRVERN